MRGNDYTEYSILDEQCRRKDYCSGSVTSKISKRSLMPGLDPNFDALHIILDAGEKREFDSPIGQKSAHSEGVKRRFHDSRTYF